ncbi:hypothetical protein RHCRD62_20151 [Rhodococcus sp. RD6.2]|nr:hypothetical protein RHCRD62_20151 [Rhodococcus sp. RD6.2]
MTRNRRCARRGTLRFSDDFGRYSEVDSSLQASPPRVTLRLRQSHSALLNPRVPYRDATRATNQTNDTDIPSMRDLHAVDRSDTALDGGPRVAGTRRAPRRTIDIHDRTPNDRPR